MISRLRNCKTQRAEQDGQSHRNAHARQKDRKVRCKGGEDPVGEDRERDKRHYPQARLLQDRKLLNESRIRLPGRQSCSAQRHGFGGDLVRLAGVILPHYDLFSR